MQSLSATLRRMLPGVAFAVAASGPAALGAQQGTWALTNARIETVTKGVIEKGTIIIRDGLITAVGADVAIPADARVIDYSKRTISPALIDLTSSLGLPAGAPAAGGGGRGGAGGPAAAGSESKFNGFDPNRVVSEEVKVGAADTRAAREGGIGAALVAPTRGALRGMSVLVPMKDSANGFDAVKVNVAQHFGFSGGGGGFGGGGRNAAGENLPGTIMGVIAYQRQALYDARRYGQILDRWKADPTGIARPTNDPELESLVPAARGQMPIFYDTPQENDIRRAVKMAKEFDLKFTLVGVTEGFKALDALAGYPVVVSTNFPQPASVTGWSYRNAMRQNPGDSLAADREARKAIEGNAAALHKAGVKFALGSGGMRGVDFLANIAGEGLLADPTAVSIGQVRQYTGEPYHEHVLRVAELVRTRTQDQEVLAAACLHDVLEDVEPKRPEFGRDAILERFGRRVLDLVLELTDIYTKENHPDKTRKIRKQLEAERLSKVSEEAKLIKRADLHDNGSSFTGTSFEKTWNEEKKVLDELLGAW